MATKDARAADSSKARSDDDLLPLPDINLPEGVTSLGRTLVIKGELTAEENLIIEGTVEGHVAVPDHGVAVGQHATVSADIMAKTVTILGRANGVLTASDKVELRASASVTGRIIATKVAIIEGAFFDGSIDPTRTEAAIAVGKHRLKQRNAPRPANPIDS